MLFSNEDRYLAQTKIMSLWEVVQRFHPEVFSGVIEFLSASMNSLLSDEVISDADKASYRQFVAGLAPSCSSHTASTATIQKILRLLSEGEPTLGQFGVLAEELKGRIMDEMQATLFLSLSPEEVEYYNAPRKGWEAVIARFPNTVGDVEEARKCFALGRYAAAIFHSLQVVEIGLIELGEFIGVNDPISGWTAVAKKLKAIVEKNYQDRSEFEKRNFAFLEQIQGTVEALKNAWRNKISHSQGRLILLSTEFNEEIAEEILTTSRAFMRRLSTEMPNLIPEE